MKLKKKWVGKIKKIESADDLIPLVKMLESFGLVVYDHGVTEGEPNQQAHLLLSLENLKGVKILATNAHGRVVAFEWELK